MDAKLGRRGLITRGAAGFVLCLAGKTQVQAQAPAQSQAQAPRPLRLLMLGDSITAAYGLSRPEGLPARLEAALRAGAALSP